MLYDKKWDASAKVTPARELCLIAADVIELVGWCQEKLQDHGGRVCLVGALMLAERECPRLDMDDLNCARRMLREYLGTEEEAAWNDKSGRTKEEVVAVLRAVGRS